MDYRVRLHPVGTELTASPGATLKDLLFEHSVEFPCGGQGRCRGCRVRVLEGNLPVTPTQQERLTEAELQDGWRLACQCSVGSDLVLELRQWDASILTNESAFSFVPQEGLGVAIDVVNTTLEAQLLELTTGAVLGVRTALNPQSRFGSDVMSRVQYAVAEDGATQLRDVICRQLGALIHQLVEIGGVQISRIRKVTLVGNTVMHHLACGIDLEPLSHYPFEAVNDGLQRMLQAEQEWGLAKGATAHFLPCMGSFVGSDILAGVLATGLHLEDQPSLLVDLGTNGEIVVGNSKKILCASTAAGPAFEGARISMGMRAASGAIWKVSRPDNQEGPPHCEVLGNVAPAGLCGSGLVDAVAVGLEMGWIKKNGKIVGSDALALSDPITLTQTDIRQLQLAKGAIAAGIKILLGQWGIGADDLAHIYLAGAFGNYIDRASAQRIGLIEFAPERVQPVGNSALLGAKLALFTSGDDGPGYRDLISRSTHIGLTSDPAFQDTYVDCMGF